MEGTATGQAWRPSAAARARWRPFFVGIAIAMLIVVALGFGRSFFLRPWSTSKPLPAYLVAHGVVMTLWYILFLAQVALVRVRRTDLHRKLGYAGLVLAGLVVVTAFVVNLNLVERELASAGPRREAAVGFALASLSSVVPFVALVAIATWKRRVPGVHKRLMFWAFVWMLGPAFTNTRPIGEALDPLVAPYLPFFPADLFWLLALAAYDLVTLRRLHPATYVTFAALAIYFLVATPAIASSRTLQSWFAALAVG